MEHLLLTAADLMISIGLLKATMLVAVSLLLIRGLRRSSAAARAGMWGFAVLALISLPVLWCVVPWWGEGVIAFPRTLFDSGTELQAGLARLLGAPAIHGGPPPALWLAVVWIAVTVVLAAHFLWQRLGVELIARTADAVRDHRTLAAVTRIQASIGFRRPIRAVYSALARAPFAFGVWRPTIVLPWAAHEWNDARLDAVLRHEVAHIARADYLLLLIGELARALYWPNPAVWLALAALRRDQDAACDDLVLRGGVPATSYARHLVAIARTAMTAPRGSRAALPLLGADLGSRIAAVLDRTSDRRPVARLARAFSLAVAAAIAIAVSATNLWTCPSADVPDGAGTASAASTAPAEARPAAS